jgi:hypothetical protein
MSRIKTIRTHYDSINRFEREIEKGLEATLNEIGWENVLQVLPCYCGNGEYFYTIIYKGDRIYNE